MDDSTPSPVPQELYIPQKMKAFMAEPQGCALVAALEGQFQCSIVVINDHLSVISSADGVAVDINQIEKILRDVWRKRDVQIMIREAALNASCTHICHTLLPRAYCAVVLFFSSDLQRRSRCTDIIIDQFTGKVTMFGTEQAVNKAREMMIECLTEHFGLLEMNIPPTQRTTRMGYTNSYNPEIRTHLPPNSFLNSVFPMGEPNAILTSTPPTTSIMDEPLLSASLEKHLLFPSDFSVPPPRLSPVQELPLTPPKTCVVEKIKQWIPTTEVGKILGNRAAVKKHIERQFNCVITVHTEVQSSFGATPVEIVAQNKEQCQEARNAVMSLMQSHQDKPASNPPDSGFSTPGSPFTSDSSSTTPEKRGNSRQYHRGSFRDQPKVMLALTPRKLSPSD